MSSGIVLTEWESEAALCDRLRSSQSVSVLIGRKAEAPQKFYSLKALRVGSTLEVGVLSSGLGVPPTGVILNDDSKLLVGHDFWLTCVDTVSAAIIFEKRFGGVIYEVLTYRQDSIIVIHELGAVRLNVEGAEKWTVETEIIEKSCINGDKLVLKELDVERELIVDVESGRLLPQC